MGVHSPFWKQYTHPDTNTAVFSIALEWNGSNNITLGGKNPTGEYTGTSLNLTSKTNSSTYECTDLKFGKIYYDEETEASAYFAPLFAEKTYETEFSISYQGLGLPVDLFEEYVKLIVAYNNSLHCGSSAY